MKFIILSAVINAASIYLLGRVLPGIRYSSFNTLVSAAVVYSILTIFVKPLLKILTFPLNLITFGLFSSLINLFLLYLVTRFITGFAIVPFSTHSFILFGINIPQFYFSAFWAYFVISAALGFTTSLLWKIFQ